MVILLNQVPEVLDTPPPRFHRKIQLGANVSRRWLRQEIHHILTEHSWTQFQSSTRRFQTIPRVTTQPSTQRLQSPLGVNAARAGWIERSLTDWCCGNLALLESIFPRAPFASWPNEPRSHLSVIGLDSLRAPFGGGVFDILNAFTAPWLKPS